MSILKILAPIEVPPLEPGDRLFADELERRYAAMPAGTKTELIEGIIDMQAAAKLSHGQPLAFVTTWILDRH